MPAYLIKSEATITRQEGDNSEVVFIIPPVFSLLNFGTVTFLKFAVYSRSGTLLFEKTWEDFVIDVQQATIYLVPEDTRGNFGLQRWELQYSEIVDDQTLITTIGKGNFVINKELIP